VDFLSFEPKMENLKKNEFIDFDQIISDRQQNKEKLEKK
jgi:hypothetical protein